MQLYFFGLFVWLSLVILFLKRPIFTPGCCHHHSTLHAVSPLPIKGKNWLIFWLGIWPVRKHPVIATKTVLTTFLCGSVCVCVCGAALPSSQQGLCCSIGWNLFRGSRTQPRIPGRPVQDAAWYVLLSGSSSPRCQLSLLLLFHYQLSGLATFISRQER